MPTVISVEKLGKMYSLRHQQREQYASLRDVIANGALSLGKWLVSPFKRPCEGTSTPESEDFWALKDVSFEVRQGDRIGIIGRNGAGKSTLLKILSRITEPSTGRVRIKGRVASLLEVGTGFHPELTGRENIYLNGAILGMSRVEIQSKFDRIVDFAEVEKFLDTPVKRYSSGMYVRLAFAVAAHLDPEILVVDEVLAVGDAQFQRKCLGKMEDVAAKEGKTVLFVSHNISAINSLCSRTILLNQGSIEIYGETNEVTNKYLDGLGSKHSDVNGKFDLSSRINPYNHGIPVIEAITVYDHNDQPSNTVVMGKPATIKFKLKRISGLENLDFGIGFYTPEGFRITSATTWSNDAINNEVLKSEASVSFAFDEIPFTSGKIMMSPSVSNSRLGVIYDHPEMSCSINVLEDTVMSDKKKISRPFGIVYIDGFWQI